MDGCRRAPRDDSAVVGHSNISQTSTYLAGVATTEHDHFAAFEARQAATGNGTNGGKQTRRNGRTGAATAACNPLATNPGTPGKTKARTAMRSHTKTNKTGVDRDQPIM